MARRRSSASAASARCRSGSTRSSAKSERLNHTARQNGIRAKLAGQAAEAADKVYRDREARKELADIAERALIRRDASQR